jgi:DNA primase
MREADQMYRAALRDSAEAVAYLKSRGIDGPTAHRFGLGFAPDAWSQVLDSLGSGADATERLLRAGLVVRNDNGKTYDRFRHRIMFPIRDGRGRIVGFGGRLLGPGEPKYLNSPDTPLFDKGRTLYGLYEARQQPGRHERIIVVEGYVDEIALDQLVHGPAMATMGTAAPAENVRHLTRLSDRIVFCFDGDRAGREAAWRALEAVLPFGGGKVAIEFLMLPEGEDPDSFVRGQGAEAFAVLLGQATPLSTFMLDQASEDLSLDSADGRARLLTRTLPLIRRLPSGHYRELVIAELAERIGMPPDRIAAQLAPEPAATAAAARPAPRPSATGPRSAMRSVMTFILHHPDAASALGPVAGLDDLDSAGADLLRRMLEMASAEPRLRTGEFVERFRHEEERDWVQQLAAADPMPLENEADAPKVLQDSLEQLVARHRQSAQAAAIRRHSDPPGGA